MPEDTSWELELAFNCVTVHQKDSLQLEKEKIY